MWFREGRDGLSAELCECPIPSFSLPSSAQREPDPRLCERGEEGRLFQALTVSRAVSDPLRGGHLTEP